MFFKKSLLIILFLSTLSAVIFVACGTSDNSSSSTVTGRAFKGPISGGTVSVYAINDDGSRGELLETTSTDDDGYFSMDAYSQPIEVVITGGTFTDEATGETVDMGDAELTVFLPDGIAEGEEVAVTLLTHAAAADARQRIANGEDPLDAMRTANEEMATTFGLDGIDITKTLPTDLTNPDEESTPGDATSYAAALASISWYAMELGVDPFELIAFAECIGVDLADGKVDGDSCVGTSLNPSTAVDDREENADDFLNSDKNKSDVGSGDVDLDTSDDNVSPRADKTANAFAFADRTGVALSTLITSDTLTIKGFNQRVAITITGDASCQYSVNGGAYTATTTAISSGQTVTLQVTSSAAENTMSSCTLDINGVSDQWDVTTGEFDPIVTTDTATGVTHKTATVNGTVDDSNLAATTTTFHYGQTIAYGTTAAGTTVAKGSGATAVSAALTGLTCETLYHFKVVGDNGSAGSPVSGLDATFTTGNCAAHSSSLAAWQADSGISPGSIVQNPPNPVGGVYTTASGNNTYTVSASVFDYTGASWIAASWRSYAPFVAGSNIHGGWVKTITFSFSGLETALYFVVQTGNDIAGYTMTVATDTGGLSNLSRYQGANSYLLWGIYDPDGFNTVTVSCNFCVTFAGNGMAVGQITD